MLLDKYDARLKTPFATLGIVASETHLLHIHFLPMDVIAKAPKTNTVAVAPVARPAAKKSAPVPAAAASKGSNKNLAD